MNKQSFALIMVSMAFWVILGGGCAQQLTPQGGPKDVDPPIIVKTTPDSAQLRYVTPKVRFVFDEPIRKPTMDREIFISPFVRSPKVILSDNAKKVSIQFRDELRPQTTYIVTLTDIQDSHEGNKLESSYSLAFSTGDVLDSMEIRGRIQSPVIGQPEKEMTILLFDPDTVADNDFVRVRPAYLTKTDESGEFSFKYLRNTPFRILGVKDEDQSNSFSGSNEWVAISPDSLVTFSDSLGNLATVVLYSFLMDNDVPRVKSYKWIQNQTLSVTLSKNIKLDSAQVWYSDTLGNDSVPLPHLTLIEGTDPELLINVPTGRFVEGLIHFEGIADSLGFALDSTLRVNGSRFKAFDSPLIAKPKLNPHIAKWELIAPKFLDSDELSALVVTDTSKYDSLRKEIPLEISQSGFKVQFAPAAAPDSAVPYILNVPGAWSQDSALLDSTFRLSLKWEDPKIYGSVEGALKMDSTYSGPFVLEMLDDKGKLVRSTTDTTFTFERLKAGSYTFRIILDEDGNGVWTPGTLDPPTLPEKIWQDPTPLSIRENWVFEEYLIEVNLSGGTASAAALQNEDEDAQTDGPPEKKE
ncbi:Ig-like domain-containing protein [Pontibacter sp. G13]|uniref:Ig-like domain-containing protein n=1 Tax=Pontibacter sp. G13 TaxID=3074898 RepID=UPI0028894214|nr:Ig-like domain-containing protein [Pontibacter sp. G13]WNJ16080.1 Ig-like domain-containing protein [Pontibacter sp. G13]